MDRGHDYVMQEQLAASIHAGHIREMSWDDLQERFFSNTPEDSLHTTFVHWALLNNIVWSRELRDATPTTLQVISFRQRI